MQGHELMFELSHVNRLKALELSNQAPLRLTQLAKALSLTAAEGSRHLERLIRTSLVEKNSNSLFPITLHGGIILEDARKADFLAAQSAYFSTQGTEGVPYQFRIWGVLERAQLGAEQPNPGFGNHVTRLPIQTLLIDSVMYPHFIQFTRSRYSVWEATVV